MVTESQGILPARMRLLATRGFNSHIYEVITPGIDMGGGENHSLRVLVGRLNKDEKIDKAYLVPEDALIRAMLSKKRIFRGYKLTPFDPDKGDIEYNSVAQKIRDGVEVILAQAGNRLGIDREKL